MKNLTHQEIENKMKEVPNWRLENEMIVRDWSFKDFNEAMKFINQIANLAEKHDHHPELFNVYNKVTVRFSTHDADGLTHRDFTIAREIDNL
jgi:4a-hydroxytetrahydrobiopterin dehydratase